MKLGSRSLFSYIEIIMIILPISKKKKKIEITMIKIENLKVYELKRNEMKSKIQKSRNGYFFFFTHIDNNLRHYLFFSSPY